MATLLSVQGLNIYFKQNDFTAVKNISFDIFEGETLALVGESGSGKSLTSLSIMGLEPKSAKASEHTQGKIIFKQNLLYDLKDKHYPKNIRGKKIALIPQDPLSSLNPVYKIKDQLIEAIKIYQADLNEQNCYQKCFTALEDVKIPDPDFCLNAYPHEISGGMRQRVMIAMALINSPDLLIADEPTTALDVTVQAEIIHLLRSLRKTILFITHDLGVVAEIADRVLVMRHGELLEENSCQEIFNKPKNTYTKELIDLMPKL